jgi:hypothetical protein
MFACFVCYLVVKEDEGKYSLTGCRKSSQENQIQSSSPMPIIGKNLHTVSSGKNVNTFVAGSE